MRLWTDFNYMEDEDRVWANLDLAESYCEVELRAGQKAELFDGLGYECTGTIVAVDLLNRMVELEPDWDTWRSTKRPHLSKVVPTRDTLRDRKTGGSSRLGS